MGSPVREAYRRDRPVRCGTSTCTDRMHPWVPWTPFHLSRMRGSISGAIKSASRLPSTMKIAAVSVTPMMMGISRSWIAGREPRSHRRPEGQMIKLFCEPIVHAADSCGGSDAGITARVYSGRRFGVRVEEES